MKIHPFGTLLFLIISGSSYSQDFTVNSIVDSPDAIPGDGICDDGSGVCSLRAAVMESNALGGNHIINVPAGTFTLTIPGANEDISGTGDLDVNSNITLIGDSPLTTIINADSLDRVFHIQSGALLSASQLKLTEGYVSLSYGGGILNEGSLELNYCEIVGNIANAIDEVPGVSGGFGGGLANLGSAIISNCTFNSNNAIGSEGSRAVTGGGGGGSSPGFGGAIYNHNTGDLQITNSTISGNKAIGGMASRGATNGGSFGSPGSPGAGPFFGAGGATNGAGGNATGDYSGGGGGGSNASPGGVGGNGEYGAGAGAGGASAGSGNAAASGVPGFGGGEGSQSCCSAVGGGGGGAGFGGGIFNNGGTTSLLNVTVAFNFALGGNGRTGQGGYAGRGLQGIGLGAGIFNRSGTIDLSNTLIANNISNVADNLNEPIAVTYEDLYGTFESSDGSNLVFNPGAGSVLGGNTAGNVLGIDPLLFPLANNGGGTSTHALSLCPASPAIDAANAAVAPILDQRDFPRIGAPDIGAYEGALSDIPIDYILMDPCELSLNGSITITPQSDPMYTFTWDAAAGNQTDSIATGLGAGFYMVSITDGNGCSKDTTFELIDLPAIATVENLIVCTGGDYTYPDGFVSSNITADESHVSVLITLSGCDSTITTNLTVNSVITNTVNINVCENLTTTYPDGSTAVITASTSQTSSLTSVGGCDSLVVTNVTMLPIVTTTVNIGVCNNETVTYPDGSTAVITANTSQTSTLTSIDGCDSLVVTNVTMLSIVSTTVNIDVCNNETVTYPDGSTTVITANTSQTSTLISIDGCDSLVVTNVTMLPLPDAGGDAVEAMCSADPPIDLITFLSGTPDALGTWSSVFNSGTDFFNPAIDPAGTYTYTVTNSCGTSTTDVIVTISADPNPGTDGAITLCDSDASVDLFNLLSGNPDVGGVWSPALSSGSGVYNPALDAGGAYTYSITTSCGTFSSIVDVTLNLTADATFSYSSDEFCLNEGNPIASFDVATGGVFTISSGGVIDATNGTIDIAGSGVGTFGITYSTSGPCPDVFVLTITILDVIDPTITLVGPFCSYDAPVILQASQSGGIWSGTGVNPVTGEFNPSLAASGLNDITYTINGSCIAFSTAQMEVIPAPIVSTISDTIILNGNSVNLITTGNASAYNWTSGTTLTCDDCQSPIATPDVTTTYTVSVEENGCLASAAVTVTIDYEIVIYVPNAFTPDGDGKNDVFTPIIADIDPDQYKFLIFNRWGELIFESQHPSQGWDGYHNGMLAPDGAYVWKISCKEVSTIETHEYMGHVTLIK